MDAKEVEFQHLLSSGEDFASYVEAETTSVISGGLTGDDYPQLTLVKLHTQATVHCRACLTLLKEGFLSHAAQTLLRAMTEVLAHTYWIRQDDYGDTPRCRALCFELGSWNEIVKNVDELRMYSKLEVNEVLRSAGETRAYYKSLHQTHGCQCAGRTYRNVQESLRKIAAKHDLCMPHAIWIATSSSSHSMALSHLVSEHVDSPDIIGGPASYVERARALEWAVGIFASTTEFAWGVINPTAIQQLVVEGKKVTGSSSYERASAGDFD